MVTTLKEEIDRSEEKLCLHAALTCLSMDSTHHDDARWDFATDEDQNVLTHEVS